MEEKTEIKETEGAYSSEPQKAHPTKEFTIVVKLWPFIALFGLLACDHGQ